MAQSLEIIGEMPQGVDHFFALMRSGHHAMIDYVIACYAAAGMSATHENDIYRGQPETDPTADKLVTTALGHTALIVNYEDCPVSDRDTIPVYSDLNEAIGNSRVIVGVRDFFTLAASRLHTVSKNLGEGWERHPDVDWPNIEKIWLDHATVLENDTGSDPNVIGINYNRWFSSAEYRAELAHRLGLVDPGECPQHVPKFGGGSSFDKLAHDGNAGAMNVLARWQNLAPGLLPVYLEVIESCDARTLELNEELFGIQPEIVESEVVQQLQDAKPASVSVA